MAQQEGPGVDEVDAVHGHHDDAVPPLEAPGQAVLDEERVREHKTMLLVPEEDGALAARAHLQGQSQTPKSFKGTHVIATRSECDGRVHLDVTDDHLDVTDEQRVAAVHWVGW